MKKIICNNCGQEVSEDVVNEISKVYLAQRFSVVESPDAAPKKVELGVKPKVVDLDEDDEEDN
jgi:hypothetical protein